MTPATSILLAIIATLLVIITAAALIILDVRPRRSRPLVLVVLKSGDTIRGTLLHRRPTYLALAGAELLEGNAAPRPIDGTTFVDRSNIDFVQAPRS